MARIATGIEESKRLLELGINPNTADMRWRYNHNTHKHDDIPQVLTVINWDDAYNKDIPCWSLTALLSVLPNPTLTQYSEDKWNIAVFDKKDNHFKDECFADEPVDACIDMICKLKNGEQNNG